MKWALLTLFCAITCDNRPRTQVDNSLMQGRINGTEVQIPINIMTDAMTVDQNNNLIAIRDLHDRSTNISAFGFALTISPNGFRINDGLAEGRPRLGVEVSNFDFRLNRDIPASSLATSLGAQSQFGPYIPAPEIYQLEHWRSLRSSNDISGKDIFFSKKQGTFILCDGNSFYRSQVNYGLCVQKFNIPELAVVVSIDYDRPSLSAWWTLEKNVRSMILSFRVIKEFTSVG